MNERLAPWERELLCGPIHNVTMSRNEIARLKRLIEIEERSIAYNLNEIAKEYGEGTHVIDGKTVTVSVTIS